MKTKTNNNSYFVDGLSAAKDYFKFRPELVKRLYIKKEHLEQNRKDIPENVPVIYQETLDPKNMPFFSKSPLVLEVTHTALDEDSFFRSKSFGQASRVLLLDHVSDPRNLGALARTAAFFSIPHIIVPKDRQVLLTDASVSTAQGAFCFVDLVVVTNLTRTLEKLKEENFWVVGAGFGGQDYRNLKLPSFDKLAVVLGSEGKGLGKNITQKCDLIATIPGGLNTTNSLNVSVAGGILLSACMR